MFVVVLFVPLLCVYMRKMGVDPFLSGLYGVPHDQPMTECLGRKGEGRGGERGGRGEERRGERRGEERRGEERRGEERRGEERRGEERRGEEHCQRCLVIHVCSQKSSLTLSSRKSGLMQSSSYCVSGASNLAATVL